MNDDITHSYRALNSALYAFLRLYMSPGLEPENILAGDQQNMVLPQDEDYAIYTITNQVRHGTNAEIYDPNSETMTLATVNEVTARVDCYACSTNSSQDEAVLRAQIRANNLNTLFRSSIATEFFHRYGISALYADDAQNTNVVSDSQQYLHRWTVNLHLSFKSSVTVPVPSFDHIEIKPNSLITAEAAEQDPAEAGRLHVADADVKIQP